MSIFDVAKPEKGHLKRKNKGANRELVKLLGERMISRKDVKAIEGKNGAWRPATDTGKADGKRLPFTMADFEAHLRGDVTLGHYLIGTDDTAKLFVLDIDLDKEGFYVDYSGDDAGDKILRGGIKCNPREVWADPSHPGYEFFKVQMVSLADGLAHLINRTLDIPVAVLSSGGKGMHVYGFCGPRPAGVIRDLALGSLNHLNVFEATRGDNFFKHKNEYHNFTIEVFPKQSTLAGKDLGNLVRLPLGVNRKTGNRSHFISLKGKLGSYTEMNPIRALQGDLPWE